MHEGAHDPPITFAARFGDGVCLFRGAGSVRGTHVVASCAYVAVQIAPPPASSGWASRRLRSGLTRPRVALRCCDVAWRHASMRR